MELEEDVRVYRCLFSCQELDWERRLGKGRKEREQEGGAQWTSQWPEGHRTTIFSICVELFIQGRFYVTQAFISARNLNQTCD